VFPVTNHKRELFYGLIRIHVLLHARQEPIFGLAMMEELAHHGYRIGPGTLYPLLHGLERAGLLKSQPGEAGGRARRLYKITAAGRRALKKAGEKVDELHRELHEAHPRRIGGYSVSPSAAGRSRRSQAAVPLRKRRLAHRRKGHM